MYLFDFSQFLLEQTDEAPGANIHLEHAEDAMFDEGHAGGKSGAHYIHSLANGLRGKHGPDFKVTTKYDGAPAVIFGTHPATGKFFVGTKSVFAKTPKINYSHRDIEKHHGDSPGLVTKLKAAYTHLKKLNVPHGEVYQGDMMYTPEDLKSENIDGKEHISFTPNTLTYAVPHGTDDAKKIARSKMGIIVHTGYKNFGAKEQSVEFSPDISHFQSHPDVWHKDAQMSKPEGEEKLLSAGDHKKIVEHLKIAHEHMDNSADFLDSTAKHPTLKPILKMFVNDNVKRGIDKPTKEHLVDFITKRHTAEADKLKTQTGKDKVHARRIELINHVLQNSNHIHNTLTAHHNIAKAKSLLIDGLKKTKGIATYSKTSKVDPHTGAESIHHEAVEPEGFVMVDSSTGKALKAVKREQFSRMNFEKGKMGALKRSKEGEENG